MMIADEASYRDKRYRFSRDFRHSMGVATVPLISTELYGVCNETPILFAKPEGVWQVVGVLNDVALHHALIDAEGRWTGDYSPFLLRIHPFRRAADESWEVAPENVLDAPGRGKPFFGRDGEPTDEFARIKSMLAEADEGRAVLSRRAATLEAAGLLTPFATGFVVKSLSPALAPLFCVDGLRLAKAAPALLARLVDGAPSSLDLAFASVHSMRLLDGAYPDRASADLESRIAALIDQSAKGARPSAGAAKGTPQDDGAANGEGDGGEAMPRFDLDRSESIDFSRLF
jgi:hypothetical protein